MSASADLCCSILVAHLKRAGYVPHEKNLWREPKTNNIAEIYWDADNKCWIAMLGGIMKTKDLSWLETATVASEKENANL